MAGSVSRFALLVSKFRGCLVGSLVGDCLGALPEVEQALAASVGGTIGGRRTSQEGEALPFSAHTRVLRCVGESLLSCREFDRDDLTQRLVHENAVNKRFPAMSGVGSLSQGGIASFGNLSTKDQYQADVVALRTTPFALFYFVDVGKLVEAAKESITVWHHPRDGDLSAILYCLATHAALQFDPIHPLNVELFLDRLMSAMAEVEAGAERTQRKTPVVVNKDKLSLRKLESIREMLWQNYTVEKAVSKLDDSTSESNSVPAAIFAFLQAQQRRKEDNKNPIEQVLNEAVSVSRSGEALASLSCSLTGAFHGIEAVPVAMRKHCQGLQETVKLADRLALQFESRPPGLVDMKEISFDQRV